MTRPSQGSPRQHISRRVVVTKKQDRLRQLEDALQQVKVLRGLLPICMYCKKIRDGENYWEQVEAYLTAHSEATFTHSICPCCDESIVKPELTALARLKDEG
jgi:phosphoserine phosphatase RsbU/P